MRSGAVTRSRGKRPHLFEITCAGRHLICRHLLQLVLTLNHYHLDKESMRFSNKKTLAAGHLLGYWGLAPFVTLAALSFLVSSAHRPAVIFSLLTYGVTIVSFLGAIHWGLTMVESVPNKRQLVWGVVPSLLAWISLMIQVEYGLLLVAAVLLLCLVIDYNIYPNFGLDHWLRMRLHLSVVAIVSTVLPLLSDFSWLF